MNSSPTIFTTPLKASITRRQTLKDIPSASGVEVVNDQIYIIGDDSLFLYVLNREWKLVHNIPLLPGKLITGRIPKKHKPDFEMMTHLNYEGENMLMIGGSGSKSPERDGCFLVNLSDNSVNGPYSLTGIYDSLKSITTVVGSGKLNLEGLAADATRIFFLQRGNISGNNTLISYDLQAFYRWLTQSTSALPTPAIEHYELLSFSNIRSGFSGATLLPNSSQLLFTASVEDTINEIDDGETLASYVGIIDLNQPSSILTCGLITIQGQPYTGKVESIAVTAISALSIQALAVTDNDLGDSEILEILLTW